MSVFWANEWRMLAAVPNCESKIPPSEGLRCVSTVATAWSIIHVSPKATPFPTSHTTPFCDKTPLETRVMSDSSLNSCRWLMQVSEWRVAVSMAILEAAGFMFDKRDQWMVFMCWRRGAVMTKVWSGIWMELKVILGVKTNRGRRRGINTRIYVLISRHFRNPTQGMQVVTMKGGACC